MDQHKQVIYWVDSSLEDIISAESIFNNGNYDWSLFIAHLALEKILKAYFVAEKNVIPPKTHKLDKLAEESNLLLSDEHVQFLKKVNEFNLEARYPEYKKQFRKICTRQFAEKYLLDIKEFHTWIISQIKSLN